MRAAAIRSDEIPAEVARRVRLVVFDVDGVLTDAGVLLGRTAAGAEIELKRFDITDGLGIKMLMWAGIQVAFVSGRLSEATAARAAELGVEECLQDGGAHKVPLVEALLERHGVGWDEVAMGCRRPSGSSRLRARGAPGGGCRRAHRRSRGARPGARAHRADMEQRASSAAHS